MIDAVKLLYTPDECRQSRAIRALVKDRAFDYFIEDTDDDTIILVLNGCRPAEDYAELLRHVADNIIPAFGLEVYVPNEHVVEAHETFDRFELEASYETRY